MSNHVNTDASTSLLPSIDLSVQSGDLKKGSLASIMVAATGVVFGDIGTSPLYALQECFSSNHGIPFSQNAKIGRAHV
mgnify:CR=1 FL=1